MDATKPLPEALLIPAIEDATLRLDDCRRLTGPGLFWDRTGAVADVAYSAHSPQSVGTLWQKHARFVLDALGWNDELICVRHFEGGSNLVLSGPIDQLFTAAFAAETAWRFCAAEILGRQPGDLAAMVNDLRSLAQRERNPALIELAQKADDRGIDLLIDDEEISLGYGEGSATWPLADIPKASDTDWPRLHNLPVALITGTNGKTTTTRLCAAMSRRAGFRSGLSSTDGVHVGDIVLGDGDFSGPAGARLLLRDRRVQIAALEVARGGILRRGLPVRYATVAVVTNVADDHLGHYGIMTVPELAAVKMSIRRGLKPGGILVLNADDPNIVAEAAGLIETIWWFSLYPGSPRIESSLKRSLACGWFDGTDLLLSEGTETVRLLAVRDVPIALSGAARYNIQNALAASLACRALGIGLAPIRAALAEFRNDPVDNPGRCNEFSWNGARVFVDFAHNPHSIAAVTSALGDLPARRRFLLISHAGDRSDQDIQGLAKGANAMRPDIVVVAENPGYLRGRTPGEVPEIIRKTFLGTGLPAASILSAISPAPGAAAILDQVGPGDLALLLVHADRDRIFAMLAGHEVI